MSSPTPEAHCLSRFESGLRGSAIRTWIARTGRRVAGRASLAVFLASACGGGSDPPADVPDAPPDLTGTYDLTSFSSALLTSGATLTPPGVSGTLVLQQSPANGAEASGDFDFDVQVPDGGGGVQDIDDQGTYTVRADGSWEQRGALVQGVGTYSLSGSALVVRVTEPALNVSTSMWRRR